MASFNEVIAEMIVLLNKGASRDARMGAAVGLGRAGGPAAVQALRVVMHNARTGEERGAAAAALGEILGRGQPADLAEPE